MTIFMLSMHMIKSAKCNYYIKIFLLSLQGIVRTTVRNKPVVTDYIYSCGGTFVYFVYYYREIECIGGEKEQ